MSLTRNDLESDLFDFDVYHLGAPYEAEPVLNARDAYVVAKVPAEDLETIHSLEARGYQYIECQLQATGRLRKPYETGAFPYDLVHVEDEAGLAKVLGLVQDMFVHDRFTTDPWLAQRGGGQLSTQRYQAYVRSSFASEDQEITALVSRKNGDWVAFATHKFISGNQVLLLIGGVRHDLQNAGIGAINDYVGLNDLLARGYTRLTTHFSAINYPILNLEIRGLGFRLRQANLVLRKTFEVS